MSNGGIDTIEPAVRSPVTTISIHASEHESTPPDPEGGYGRYIDECRKRRSTSSIATYSACHARHVIRNLLILAAERTAAIRLFTGRLASEVYGGLEDYLLSAIARGCDIKIITVCGHNEIEQSDFLKSLPLGSIKCMGRNDEERSHYMVVGTSAYRLETDDRTRAATTCFHDGMGIVASALVSQFDDLWNSL